MGFQLNEEQQENIRIWRRSLDGEEARTWSEREEAAEKRFQEILAKAKFEAGGDLTAEDCDEIFSSLRKFANNRTLSNLLYKSVGLDNFNRQLRNLYYGNDPFAKRVDDFFKLKGMGILTVSQFLVAYDPQKYPLISSQTKETLDLDATQEEAARKEALEHYDIQEIDSYLDRTIDFLKDCIIFESIKSFTGLEKYSQINNLLWFGKVASEVEEEVLPFSSVSLEKDLRDYLASNPSAIEKGLGQVQKEFDTKEVGKIDLLCKDKNGNSVIVELKKGRESEKVVGQISRYMGWVMKNLKANARGIIVVNEPDDRLEYAIVPFKGTVSIKYYRVKFELSDKYSSDS